MKQEYWFHRHPGLTLSAVAILGCCAAIISVELAARVFFPEWIPATIERVEFWTYDPLLGWAQAPNHRGRFTHRDFSVEIATDSQGLRDDEYPTERTGKKRMLILGDSFGWGFGVEHHERFSEVLEAAHPDWEIINASAPGYGTDQEFLYLREKGTAFKPDVVLALFCVNDFDENVHEERYWYFKPVFVIERERLSPQNVPVPKATTKQRLQRFFLGTTYLGPMLNSAKDSFVRWVGPSPNQTGPVSDNNSGEEARMCDITHLLIKAMNELCKENHSMFILASVPMDSTYTAFLREMTELEDITYVALDASFESTSDRTSFPHDGHWNARGHEIAAAAIDSFLWKSGILEVAE